MRRQGGEKSPTLDAPIILLGICVIIYAAFRAAWYFAHIEISMIYMNIRYLELWLLNALGSIVDMPGVSTVRNWIQNMCQPDGLVSQCHRDFSMMEWESISNSSVAINVFLLVLLVILCVRMFLLVNATHPELNFTKKHNIESFVNESKRLYPHLRMFSKIDFISQSLDHPVYGMSLTSRQFVYRHRLISGWKKETDNTLTPILDRKKTMQVFRAQLGKHWTKSTEMSPSETLVVAIVIPRVAATDSSLTDAEFNDAMDESKDLLEWCWNQFKPPVSTKKKKSEADQFSWLHPEIDLEYPRSIILKHIGHPAVQVLIERHAYVRTIIYALFGQARRLGVLQPAELRWMRFFDRELWYLLQVIGRQAVFVEAAAVHSHYLYESKSGTALAEPQLDKAINGLELATTNFKFVSADKERYEHED